MLWLCILFINKLHILVLSRAVGLTKGAKMEEEVWNEFYGNTYKLAYESEMLIAQISKTDIAASVELEKLPQGEEREALVKQRVNQSFFRSAVMAAYDYRCCISGIGNSELLEACHIASWAEDENNRTNPKNGICLNALFHKAYDTYLLSISPDHRIAISERMLISTHDTTFRNYLSSLKDTKIRLPKRFTPQAEFLEQHYDKFRKAQ